jgi:heme exporter protein C
MKARYASTVFVAGLIFFAGYAALFIAPDEKTMHAIQRIFYFHLPSWIAMFTALSIVFVANVAYLATRKPKWDALGVSGTEAAVVCCTIGLATGPLWAKPVWGIWWTWDARLTTTFILWLLYISYLLLRGLLDDPERKATFSAVFWMRRWFTSRTACGARSIRNLSSGAAAGPDSIPGWARFSSSA